MIQDASREEYIAKQCIGAALEALPYCTIVHIPVLPLLCVPAKQPPEHREASWIILLFSGTQAFRILLCIFIALCSTLPFISYLFYVFKKKKKKPKNIFPTLTYSFISIICNTLNHLSSWKEWGRCMNVIWGIFRHLQ